MVVLDRPGDFPHFCDAGVNVDEDLHPLVHLFLLENSRQLGDQDVLCVTFNVLVLNQILAVDRLAQRRPELRFQRCDHHEASVADGINVVTGIAPEKTFLAALRPPLGRRVVRDLHRHQPEQRVEHRDIDQLPRLALVAVLEGEQDSDHSRQRSRCHVGDLDAGHQRHALAVPEQVKHAGQCQIVQVMAGLLGVRASLAVSCQRCVDDLGIDLAKGFVAQPQLLHHAGTESI